MVKSFFFNLPKRQKTKDIVQVVMKRDIVSNVERWVLSIEN